MKEKIYLKKIIKSCKAINLEFLKLKEKLDLCLYESICDEQELISMSGEIFKEEKIFIQHDVHNKQLKEENEKLIKENENENEKLRKENENKNENENEQIRKNYVVKDATTKESVEKPKEIKRSKEDKNTTNFDPNSFDKNKFKNVLAIIDSKHLVTGIK